MRIRLLRGQVAIREIKAEERGIWIPDPSNPREVLTHRGRVLGMGEPAQINSHDVPWGFVVGDVVVYHHEKWEKGATRPWPADGEDACWMHQSEIDGVWEP
jgi:co-chaperonin GroES (HSP10)